MSKKIIDAKTDENGDISDIKFAGDRQFLPIDQAMKMIRQGEVENAYVASSGNDTSNNQ